MPKKYIPKEIRLQVEERAGGSCEYCKCLKNFSPDPFACEHIIAFVLGGTSNEDNLAQSCGGCNSAKHTAIEALDPITNQIVPLFHPRKDIWSDHFEWSDDFLLMIGKTPTGRATIIRLKTNRPSLINLRGVLKLIKKHPPS